MMRIASLLPSASEIVCDIGLKDNLVAISHECNYPKSLEGLKVITNSSIDSNQDQYEIDTQVRKKVQSKLPLYEINTQLLNELKPDVIITQGLCDVCAISSSEIEVVAIRMLRNLEPMRPSSELGRSPWRAGALRVKEA